MIQYCISLILYLEYYRSQIIILIMNNRNVTTNKPEYWKMTHFSFSLHNVHMSSSRPPPFLAKFIRINLTTPISSTPWGRFLYLESVHVVFALDGLITFFQFIVSFLSKKNSEHTNPWSPKQCQYLTLLY